MKGLKRTHRCGELSAANIGEKVTVMGWVQKQRNKGGIIFVDLRDRAGILQVIFEESDCGTEHFAKAEKLRSEFVAAVTGRVEKPLHNLWGFGWQCCLWGSGSYHGISGFSILIWFQVELWPGI